MVDKEEKNTYKSIPQADKEEHYELSHAQRGLWILHQFEDTRSAYNISAAYTFEGEVNIECLRLALQTLVTRHESLRTVFLSVDGEPRQKIIHSDDYTFDLDYESNTNSKIELEKIAESEFRRSFDLENGPLMRTKLISTGQSKYLFLFSMHHIVSDGWSMEILVREVLTLYSLYIQGKESTLKPLRIHYKDYSCWQRKFLESDQHEKSYHFWENQLKGKLPRLDLITDYERPKIQTFNGALVVKRLDRETTKDLRAFVQEENYSLYILLLTVINIVLYKYSGSTDILIGSPSSGREHEDLVDQIGYYINILVHRTKIDSESSAKELLDQVKKNTLETFKHQNYPFDKVVDRMNLERDERRAAVYDVGFTWNMNNDSNNFPEIEFNIEPVEYETGVSKTDLWFFGNELSTNIEFSLQFNTDLFKRERSTLILDQLELVLQKIVKKPNETIKTLLMKQSNQRKIDFSI